MLDRSKVIKELQVIADKLFVDFSPELEKAKESWAKITQDPTFIYKVKNAPSALLVPTWEGDLGATFPVPQPPEMYQILAVDGSQIYPDRHQGTSCFLINIGIVELFYGIPGKGVNLSSTPYVYVGSEDEGIAASADLVNCRRQELEFQAGVERGIIFKNSAVPSVFLFDGSLIFWHLESKDQQIKNIFLPSYLAMLENFYAADISMAGYISLPKSKELINLVRLDLCNFVIEGCHIQKEVEHLVDANLMRAFLAPKTRTAVFENHSNITEYYPAHLKPYFFYLHVGNEVVRVELPAWLGRNEARVDEIAALILDQCNKGRGYPVGLAEAHEQAVVKGPDRDFFYHLIQKVGMDHNQRLALSQKVIKKRGLGI
jgi:hypothetical protein